LCTNTYADICLYFYSSDFQTKCCYIPDNSVRIRVPSNSLHNVEFRFFLQGFTQLRDCDPRNAPLRNYKSLFKGTSGDLLVIKQNYGLFEQLLMEAHGSSHESLRIIHTMREHLADCYKKRMGPIPTKRKNNGVALEELKEALETTTLLETLEARRNDELAPGGPLRQSIVKMDEACNSFLTKHVSTWNRFGGTEQSLSINEFIDEVASKAPCSWFSAGLLKSPRSKLDKRGQQLLQLVSMLRQRNPHYLSQFALILSFSSLGRGYSLVSQGIVQEMRLQVHDSTLRAFMQKYEVTANESITKLLGETPNVKIIFDNVNISSKKFNQTNQQSNEFIIATNVATCKDRVQIWPPGTTIRCQDTGKIYLIKAVDKSNTDLDNEYFATYPGRADRIGAEGRFYCKCSVCIEDFESRWLQIHDGTTKVEIDEKKEDQREVMEMMFLPTDCIHQLMETYLEDERPYKRPRLGDCKNKCWVCQKKGMQPIANKDDLVNLLGCSFARGPVRCRELRSIFFDNKEKLWPGRKEKDTVIQSEATLLTFKLIAAGILLPRIESRGRKNEEKWVMLGWNILDETTADKIEGLWARIPIDLI
jgi:hypothetical protein